MLRSREDPQKLPAEVKCLFDITVLIEALGDVFFLECVGELRVELIHIGKSCLTEDDHEFFCLFTSTPRGERIYIGFFGMRNAGKSSVVNAFTNQEIAIVSDVKGTTTDPVYKAMELLPLGPVMIVDTPGMDDEGELGMLRIEKCKEVMAKVDIAILVVDGTLGMNDGDRMLKKMFEERNLPYITVYNKLDLVPQRIGKGRTKEVVQDSIWVSASDKINITDLKEMVAHLVVDPNNGRKIIADLISEGDIVVLVTPIDEAAPKGRLILPQQQTLRDILDSDAIGVVTQVPQIPEVLASLP